MPEGCNELVSFTFEAITVRIVEFKGRPWWVASDVAAILGYQTAATMARGLDADEKGYTNLYTLGGDQRLIIVSESGVYHAIFRSKRPEATRFRRWVTEVLLPAIRRGVHILPGEPIVDLQDPDEGLGKRQGERFKEERERIEKIYGMPLTQAAGLSKARIRSIEELDETILKPHLINALIGLGFDLQYLRYGRRTLTRAERAIRDAYRAAPDAQRQLMLAQASSIDRSPRLLQDAYGEIYELPPAP